MCWTHMRNKVDVVIDEQITSHGEVDDIDCVGGALLLLRRGRDVAVSMANVLPTLTCHAQGQLSPHVHLLPPTLLVQPAPTPDDREWVGGGLTVQGDTLPLHGDQVLGCG